MNATPPDSMTAPLAPTQSGAGSCAASGSALDERIAYLKRRLSVHRRRLKYWSGNPSFSGYGPTGKQLRAINMDEHYELAKDDASSVAWELEQLGVKVEVIDPRRTFKVRYHNPNAPAIFIWPNTEPTDRD